MVPFRTLLVCIDPLKVDQLRGSDSQAAAGEAVRKAMLVAEKSRAAMRFFAVVDTSAQRERLSRESPPRASDEIAGAVQTVLDQLVQTAAHRRIAADRRVTLGVPWIEIAREVERQHHDLAFVAGAEHGYAWPALLGRTTIRLLHNCPAAVWVARPHRETAAPKILIADDLSSLGQRVLRMAATLGALLGATVHLLHAIEDPLARAWQAGLGHVGHRLYLDPLRAEAESIAAEQIQMADLPASDSLKVHIEIGRADSTILDFVVKHDVQLLVLGTAARRGLSGVVLGNTAERLLPYARCSLLAVKPEDFRSPLPVESQDQLVSSEPAL